MAKTLFQRIADGEIPAKLVHQDDRCVAFHDIAPQAPVHILVVPREPVARIAEASAAHAELVGHLLLVAARVAADQGLRDGFRLVVNNGRHGGETVPHLHVHLLGGRALGWPPG
ncbi:MAG: histidine triad nucleotide-binding protein [Opitutia bacterium]|jgi:histidine triad (HIT) family protein